jgi:hypothetical protein
MHHGFGWDTSLRTMLSPLASGRRTLFRTPLDDLCCLGSRSISPIREADRSKCRDDLIGEQTAPPLPPRVALVGDTRPGLDRTRARLPRSSAGTGDRKSACHKRHNDEDRFSTSSLPLTRPIAGETAFYAQR